MEMNKHRFGLLSSPTGFRRSPERRTAGSAGVRTVILVLACLLAGAGATLLWSRLTPHHAATPGGTTAILSERTRTVLQDLPASVEIRFYALLNEATVAPSLPEFAVRVDSLLAAYRDEAGDRISVKRYSALTGPDAAAAAADGIRPFNLEKGAACFLGLAVVCNGQKESLPHLSPEWEQALEFDLTRAIERVVQPPQVVGPALDDTGPDAAVVERVRRAIPDLASVSLEEGKQILREAALDEIRATVREMERQVQDAEQRFQRAQAANAASEQEAALKQIRQLKSDEMDQFRKIAVRVQSEITAFERLKAGAQGNP